MSGPELTVGRGVIAELVRLAALEVPGVVRVGAGGPAWRTFVTGPDVSVRVRNDRVRVRLRVVARPGHSLVELTGQVRTKVAATVERLLGLDLDAVTVIVAALRQQHPEMRGVRVVSHSFTLDDGSSRDSLTSTRLTCDLHHIPADKALGYVAS